MLTELSIKNFILIDDLMLKLSSGFNVLTGETGAGKSMVIGALTILAGATAYKDFVGDGVGKASINAVFEPNDDIIREFADFSKENGLDFCEEDPIILSREIGGKKSIARINGSVTTNAIIKRAAGMLYEIHGQNEQLELFNRNYQLDMLDRFSGHGLTERLADLYNKMTAAEKTLAKYEALAKDKDQQIGFLEFQINEIENVGLKKGEDDELEAQLKYLTSKEEISHAVARAQNWLTESDDNALANIGEIIQNFIRLDGLSEEVDDLCSLARQSEQVLIDFSRAINNYADLDFNDGSLNEVENRLNTINSLKHKFGNSLNLIEEKLQDFKEELDELHRIGEQIHLAREEFEESSTEYFALARQISLLRKKSAAELEEQILLHLVDLNMPETRIKIELKEGTPGIKGIDEIDFLISTAVGRPLQTIKKVVSGGELSRIMLAVKIVTKTRACLIFDEVDAGISGNTANIVGEKLRLLSDESQIICITHLPQIAVFADSQTLITKTSDENRTVTSLHPVYGEERVAEIARLVAGRSTDDIAMQHAKKMLEHARRRENVRGDEMDGLMNRRNK